MGFLSASDLAKVRTPLNTSSYATCCAVSLTFYALLVASRHFPSPLVSSAVALFSPLVTLLLALAVRTHSSLLQPTSCIACACCAHTLVTSTTHFLHCLHLLCAHTRHFCKSILATSSQTSTVVKPLVTYVAHITNDHHQHFIISTIITNPLQNQN